MKTKTIFLVMTLIAAASCNKNNGSLAPRTEQENRPICFSVTGDALNGMATKTVADVTSDNLFSIYVSASSRNSMSVETAWSFLNDAKVDLQAGHGTSAVYWPSSGNLSFYATNWSVAKTIGSSGASLSLDYSGGNADYVAGFASDVANGAEASIVMDHILGRLYDLKLKSSDANSTATVTSITVTPEKVSGSYVFRTKEWNAASASVPAAGIAPSVTSFGSSYASVGQSAVDRTFIPGDVTINVKYSVQAGGYTKDFDKSATVSLARGVKTTVSAVLTDDKSPITFSVSVTPWQTQEINTVLN